jgi:hypothetical protein
VHLLSEISHLEYPMCCHDASKIYHKKAHARANMCVSRISKIYFITSCRRPAGAHLRA